MNFEFFKKIETNMLWKRIVVMKFQFRGQSEPFGLIVRSKRTRSPNSPYCPSEYFGLTTRIVLESYAPYSDYVCNVFSPELFWLAKVFQMSFSNYLGIL